tara:strand:+ start:4320 stop:5057 length:738 start_codon:yes stop_codon:yes gene_type:complete
LEKDSKGNQPIILLENMIIGYSEDKPLVQIPNLKIYPGEIVAIVGPSGVGKSTLLKTIAGLVKPISGRAKVCGKIIPESPLRGRLGYIPQNLGLVRHASVIHNVMLGANAGHNKPISPFLPIILPSIKAKQKAIQSINAMGLREKINEPIKRLSGGQQRRVATARTLAQSPDLIMADEFLSELDEETIDMVVNEVLKYVKMSNAALLVVEHDISRARKMADRLLVIDDGRINPFITEITAMEVEV